MSKLCKEATMFVSLKKRGTVWLLAGLCILVLASFGSQVEAEPEKTELTFWTFIDPAGDTPRGRELRQIINKFETENPTLKIKVELAGWAECTRKLVRAGEAKIGPDIVRVPTHRSTIPLDLGLLAPIDEYITDWSEAEKRDFVFPWEMALRDGHKYIFPYAVKCSMIFYREDKLKQAGLVPARDLDEFARNGAKLNQLPNTIGLGISISSKQNADNFLFQSEVWIRDEGGKGLLDEEGKAAFDSKAALRVFQWYHDLYYKYKAISLDRAGTFTNDSTSSLTRAGILAQTFQGVARLAYMREGEGVGDNLKPMPYPSFHFMLPATTAVAGDAMGIGVFSKYKDQAWKFVEFYLRPDSQMIVARVGNQTPGRKSTYQNSWFYETPEGREKLYIGRYTNRGFPFVFQKDHVKAAVMLARTLEDIVIKGKAREKIGELVAETARRFNAEVTPR